MGTNARAALSNIQDDDSMLVAAAQQGDLSSFERLVVRHQKRMLNIAFRLINDHDDACEVVQDAFVAAYKSISSFRGEAKFTTWLTTITVNLSKNRLKQVRARKEREPYSLDDPLETGDGTVSLDPPSKEPSILDRLVQQDMQKQVQDCIKALEPDFREAIVLRDMQEFSYEEICGMLKVAAGTVKSRLFRAREMVKDCLKKVRGAL